MRDEKQNLLIDDVCCLGWSEVGKLNVFVLTFRMKRRVLRK
jgi:hypothetical protein